MLFRCLQEWRVTAALREQLERARVAGEEQRAQQAADISALRLSLEEAKGEATAESNRLTHLLLEVRGEEGGLTAVGGDWWDSIK